MSLQIDLSGLELDRLYRAADIGGAAGLARAAEHVRGVSVGNTPVESGRLAGSATVHVDGDTASITYDGPYARYIHEGLVRHGSEPPWVYGPDHLHYEHGGAKFLENAVNSEQDTAEAIIAQAVREAI